MEISTLRGSVQAVTAVHLCANAALCTGGDKRRIRERGSSQGERSNGEQSAMGGTFRSVTGPPLKVTDGIKRKKIAGHNVEASR